MLLYQQSHHTEVARHGENADRGGRLFADVDLAVGDVVDHGEGLVMWTVSNESFNKIKILREARGVHW